MNIKQRWSQLNKGNRVLLVIAISAIAAIVAIPIVNRGYPEVEPHTPVLPPSGFRVIPQSEEWEKQWQGDWIEDELARRETEFSIRERERLPIATEFSIRERERLPIATEFSIREREERTPNAYSLQYYRRQALCQLKRGNLQAAECYMNKYFDELEKGLSR